jgi:uncharacterized protein YjiS (DUF1127 family)
MTCADKSTLTDISAPLTQWTSPDGLAALRRWCCHALDLRRQRHALRELDDHQLADIGVTRDEALREAKKSFWTRI